MASRIYVVASKDKTRLVRANTSAQAIRYSAQSEFKAHVATQDDLIDMVRLHQVEDATNEPEEAAA